MDAAGLALTAACGAIAGLLTGSFLSGVIVWAAAPDPGSQSPGGCVHARPRLAGLAPLAGRRGWCRACRSAYGIRYPLLELVTGGLFTVMALRFGFSPLLPAAWYLAALGVALSVIDIRQHRLPDVLTLPSYPVALLLLGGVGLLLPGGLGHLASGLIGMLAAGAFFLLLAFLQPAGIGWGDVKLSGILGFYLGWFGAATLLAGLFAAFALAALTGLALIVAGRANRKSQLPLGAFLLAAALAVIAAGRLWPALS